VYPSALRVDRQRLSSAYTPVAEFMSIEKCNVELAPVPEWYTSARLPRSTGHV